MRRRPLPSAAETVEILARKRSRPPFRTQPTAGRFLAGYLRDMEERYGKGLRPLLVRWPEIIADPRLERLTEPTKLVKLRGGGSVLELKVDGPAATLIQHDADGILARVNLVLGGQDVTRLRIVQGPVRSRSAHPPPQQRRRAAAPLDASAEAELSRSLEGAPDTPLKAALIKLGRAVLRDRSSP